LLTRRKNAKVGLFYQISAALSHTTPSFPLLNPILCLFPDLPNFIFQHPYAPIKCVSATTGNFFSYLHANSPIFPIVTGIMYHPAATPTASGKVARRRIFRFRTRMEEPIAATKTYNPPGITRSAEFFGGARPATVEVKECSRLKALVRRAFVASSADAAYLCKKRRELATCAARRSVGVRPAGRVGSGVNGEVSVEEPSS